MLVFGSLYASSAYSQASCSGGLNSGSCYANGTDLYASNIYIINCPTGNFRYTLESSCYQGGYLGEAGIWGDIISAYAESNPGQPTDREEGTVSNLNPGNPYTVEMFAWTQGLAYAYASVYGW
jgi:hypothetical protein